MGFLREKYSRTYFTGIDESGARTHYGALGADEWRGGGIFGEIRDPIDQIDLAGKAVLELGFGRGESARYLLRDVGAASYTGVDFSEAACDLACDSLASLPRDRWALHCGDALEFLRDHDFHEAFDAVLLLDTIEHIPTSEMAEILPRLYSGLRPGGYLIVDTPFYPVDEDFIAQGYRYIAPSASDLIPETRGMHCNKFTRNRLMREMRAAGFEAPGDKLFRRPFRAPLGLPADAGWSGLFAGDKGAIWLMPDARIMLPGRLFDGVSTISCDLIGAAIGQYPERRFSLDVSICGESVGTIHFSEDRQRHPLQVTLDAQGEDIALDFAGNSAIVEPAEFPPRLAMISGLTVTRADGVGQTQSSEPIEPNPPEPERTARRPKIEYVDGATIATPPVKVGADETLRQRGVSAESDLQVDRIDLIDADSRQPVSEPVVGQHLTLRCHLLARRPFARPACRYTLTSMGGADGTDAICLMAGTSGPGLLKPLFVGERAIVEFTFSLCLPAGTYLLTFSSGAYGNDGCWADRQDPTVFSLQVMKSAARVAGGGESFSRTTARPKAGTLSNCRIEHGRHGETRVAIADRSYRVEPHWFWEQFGSGWEEESFEVIRRLVRPDRAFLDVGSWIGPTALIACAHGAKRVVAVEANPSTVAHLRRTIDYNPGLHGRIEVLNRCIHRDAGSVQFGNADGSDCTSSASSLRGHGYAVQAIRLTALMEEFDVRDPSLIKIDIEGAEIFLDEDLGVLSEQPDLVIYLSLHPPFWKQMGDPAALFAALAGFRIADASGRSLPLDKVRDRCLSPDPFPLWGTAMGNFFEILLCSGSAE